MYKGYVIYSICLYIFFVLSEINSMDYINKLGLLRECLKYLIFKEYVVGKYLLNKLIS